MNIAIVEDMNSDYMALKEAIEGCTLYDKLNITISRFTNSHDFLSHFNPDKYQLLFLDIFIDGEMTGMELAKEIRKTASYQLPIVFTTCDPEFALEGYDVQALDYIVKPCSSDRINSVINRLFSSGNVDAYLTVQINREQIRFPMDSILYASSGNHAMEIHLTDHRTLRTYMKFREFCAMIPDDSNFHCCSRGIIVNMKHVDYMENGDFVLITGKKIPVSRSKKSEMKAAFNDYQIHLTRSGGLL